MVHHMKYSQIIRQFANMAREKAAHGDVLYHGTRYAKSILKSGVLLCSAVGEQKVCLTRSAEVAAYWATMQRDDDEGRGSILIFDRRSLEGRYRLEANPEVYWHTKHLFHDEAEEEIWADVIDISSHLIGVTSGPTSRRSPKHKTQNRKFMKQIEARLQYRTEG